jgi:hypothetical protein
MLRHSSPTKPPALGTRRSHRRTLSTVRVDLATLALPQCRLANRRPMTLHSREIHDPATRTRIQ